MHFFPFPLFPSSLSLLGEILRLFPLSPLPVMLSTIPGMLPSAAASLIEKPMLEFDYDFHSWEAEDYCSPEMLIFPNDDLIISSGRSETEEKPNLLLFPHQEQKSANSNSKATTTMVGPSSSAAAAVDERKRRRMISNRESARRSRMRKQRHLEHLRNKVNRLRAENRELSSRLRFVMYHCNRLRTDNDGLRTEHTMLRHKLSNIRQILTFRRLTNQFSAVTSAWPCNNIINSTAGAAEQFHSLITS